MQLLKCGKLASDLVNNGNLPPTGSDRVGNSYLGKEIHGRQEADEAEDGVEKGDLVDPLPTDVLHDAVVGGVDPSVGHEDGEKVVGGPTGMRYAEEQTEGDVDDTHDGDQDEAGPDLGTASAATIAILLPGVPH